MAKSSKVEDYWRENNIENLFKELTQLLVRRMPSDPAIAIVEHLQQKFPKSFKTSTDNNIGVFSKSLQMQSITSPHFDLRNESLNDQQIERRLSNQSQISGITTLPTVGSTFTDLLKQDTNSTRQAPELNIRNLVFANRLGQQVVKLGKDIRTDHEILEEEVIKPLKTKSTISSTANLSMNSVSEDLQHAQTHEEPSVPQIIKYKQQIRTETDRRLHREKLAELAKHQRDKEQFYQSDLSKNQPQQSDQTRNDYQSSQKPFVKSKEEEEILNDENVFQPSIPRYRERPRNKGVTSRSNTPYTTAFRSLTKKPDENLTCKVCGNAIHVEDHQQNSTALTARSFQPQLTGQSVETTTGAVDDWFESPSDVSDPRQSSPWKPPNDAIPSSTGASTFRRNLFQPINDTNIVEHRPPVRPLILPDDNETKTKQPITPRFSESGVFSRSPETKIRRPSSTRSIPSPVTKKHQTDNLAITNQQLTNDRRMSGWGVHEHSPDDSD